VSVEFRVRPEGGGATGTVLDHTRSWITT
jgi:hypothetical protein